MAKSFKLRFTIHGDPRPLALRRPKVAVIAGHARVYDPAANRSAKEQVKAAAIAETGYPETPHEGSVALEIIALVPVPSSWSKKRQKEALAGHILPTGRPDIDNLFKLIADSLQHFVIRNDSQICLMVGIKQYSARPRLIVTLKEAWDDPASTAQDEEA